LLMNTNNMLCYSGHRPKPVKPHLQPVQAYWKYNFIYLAIFRLKAGGNEFQLFIGT
jgi:hypothetical protein